MASRHTISIGDEAFQKLRRKGQFGESYTQLILRLLKSVEGLSIGGSN